MRPASRALSVLAIAVLILLPVFWLWGGGRIAPSELREGTPESTAGTDPAASDLSTLDSNRQRASDGEVDAEEQGVGSAAGLVDLSILVLNEQTRTPIPGARITVDVHEAVSDGSGQVSIRIAPGRYFLSVDPPDDEFMEVSGRFMIPAAAERELEILVREQSNLSFFGRLLSKGTAIAGAEIELHRRAPPSGEEKLFTTADGTFAVEGDREHGYVKVIAAGYSPMLVPITEGHESPEQALDIPLKPAAQLQAQVTFSNGTPAGDARVVLEHQSRLISFPTGLYRGSFFQSYSGTSDLVGLAILEDLPVHVPMSVRIKVEGKTYPLAVDPVFLESGLNELAFELPLGQTLLGRLVDENGEGIPDVRIGAHASQAGEAPKRMPAWRANRIHPVTYTDTEGKFKLDNLPPGFWLVGVQPRPGLDDFPCTASCLLVELLPGRSPDPVLIRTWTKTFISGQVLGIGEQPLDPSLIHAQRVEGEYRSSAQFGSDGSFRIGPLPPGEYDITSSIFESKLGLASPVRSMAPKEGLVLRFTEVAGGISGQIQSAADGSPRRAWISMFLRDGDHELGFHSDLDGRFRATGLQPGTWDLIANDRRGQNALVPGVQVLPGRQLENITIPLQAPGTLTIQHPPVEKELSLEILHAGVVMPTGFYTLSGAELEKRVALPPGTWTLRILVGGQESFRQDFTIAADQELRLGPR